MPYLGIRKRADSTELADKHNRLANGQCRAQEDVYFLAGMLPVEFCLSLLELYSICTIIRSSRLDTWTAQHSTAQDGAGVKHKVYL